MSFALSRSRPVWPRVAWLAIIGTVVLVDIAIVDGTAHVVRWAAARHAAAPPQRFVRTSVEPAAAPLFPSSFR